MDSTTLIFGVIYGSIGVGYFVYGKRQNAYIPLLCGVGLTALPMLVSSVVLLVLFGLILTALPFLLKE